MIRAFAVETCSGQATLLARSAGATSKKDTSKREFFLVRCTNTLRRGIEIIYDS